MINNIFIDDDRECPKNYIQIKDSNQVIEKLRTIDKINIISFDHDMGLTKLSGYDLIKNILETAPNLFDKINIVSFHTNNMVGGRNMCQILINAQKHGIINHNLYIDRHIYQYNNGRLDNTGNLWI